MIFPKYTVLSSLLTFLHTTNVCLFRGKKTLSLQLYFNSNISVQPYLTIFFKKVLPFWWKIKLHY